MRRTENFLIQRGQSRPPSRQPPRPPCSSTGGPRRPPQAKAETTRVLAALPARSSPCPYRSPRPWVASWLASALPPMAAPRAAPSRLQASAVVVTASTFGEEVAVAAEARQLGLHRCLACRAAAVKAMAMAKAKARFAAPPGDGRVAEVSFSLSWGHRSGPAGVCVSSQDAAAAF